MSCKIIYFNAKNSVSPFLEIRPFRWTLKFQIDLDTTKGYQVLC